MCIFLYGGNDHGNTLIPYDSANHAEYLAARGALGIARASLDATALTGAGLPVGRAFALAPTLAPLKALFDRQQLAVQLNVGPLLAPTTLAQYQARSVPLPGRTKTPFRAVLHDRVQVNHKHLAVMPKQIGRLEITMTNPVCTKRPKEPGDCLRNSGWRYLIW